MNDVDPERGNDGSENEVEIIAEHEPQIGHLEALSAINTLN